MQKSEVEKQFEKCIQKSELLIYRVFRVYGFSEADRQGLFQEMSSSLEGPCEAEGTSKPDTMRGLNCNLQLRNPFYILTIGISLVSCGQSGTQTSAPQTKAAVPSGVSEEIPIWSTSIPDAELITGTETYNDGIVKNVRILD